MGGWIAGLDARLERVFDGLTALPRREAGELCDGLMDTVMLTPGTLLVSGVGLLLMSGTAAALTGAGWARAWFVLDAGLLALRLVPAIRHPRHFPVHLRRRIMCVALLVFVLFGVGCALSLRYGPPALQITATASIMALIAGVATRWAALPRLATATITVASLPFLYVLATAATDHAAVTAVQFAVVALGTGLLTIQTRRTLVAMLRAERQARLLAATDPLTKLGNRAALDLKMAGLPAASGVSVLFIDLDRFKAVNDVHGHLVGDRLLAEVANRLRRAAAPCSPFRIGGDEFVVLVADGCAEPDHLAHRVVASLSRPYTGLADEPLAIGASIGLGRGTVGQDPIGVLMDRADRQLYRAKRLGGNRHVGAEPLATA